MQLLHPPLHMYTPWVSIANCKQLGPDEPQLHIEMPGTVCRDVHGSGQAGVVIYLRCRQRTQTDTIHQQRPTFHVAYHHVSCRQRGKIRYRLA